MTSIEDTAREELRQGLREAIKDSGEDAPEIALAYLLDANTNGCRSGRELPLSHTETARIAAKIIDEHQLANVLATVDLPNPAIMPVSVALEGLGLEQESERRAMAADVSSALVTYCRSRGNATDGHALARSVSASLHAEYPPVGLDMDEQQVNVGALIAGKSLVEAHALLAKAFAFAEIDDSQFRAALVDLHSASIDRLRAPSIDRLRAPSSMWTQPAPLFYSSNDARLIEAEARGFRPMRLSNGGASVRSQPGTSPAVIDRDDLDNSEHTRAAVASMAILRLVLVRDGDGRTITLREYTEERNAGE